MKKLKLIPLLLLLVMLVSCAPPEYDPENILLSQASVVTNGRDIEVSLFFGYKDNAYALFCANFESSPEIADVILGTNAEMGIRKSDKAGRLILNYRLIEGETMPETFTVDVALNYYPYDDFILGGNTETGRDLPNTEKLTVEVNTKNGLISIADKAE